MEVLPVVSCSPRRLESVLQWPAVGLSLKTRRKLNRDLFPHNICRPEHDTWKRDWQGQHEYLRHTPQFSSQLMINLDFKSILKSNLDFKKQFLHILKTTLISRQLEFSQVNNIHNVSLVSYEEGIWIEPSVPFVPKTSITSDKTQSLVLKYQSFSRLVSFPVDLIAEILFTRLFKRWFIRKRVLVRLRHRLWFQHLIYIYNASSNSTCNHTK